MTTLFSLGLLPLIYVLLQWGDSRYWRQLAHSYAGSINTPIEQRNTQHAILIGSLGPDSYNGFLNVGVHDRGVSLSVGLPFLLFRTPLFIPFDDLSGWKTTWYLNTQSVELHLQRAPGVKIVIPAELAEWIRSFTGHKITLHEGLPPDGKIRRVYYGLWLIGLACLLAVVLVTLAWLSFLLPLIQSQ